MVRYFSLFYFAIQPFYAFLAQKQKDVQENHGHFWGYMNLAGDFTPIFKITITRIVIVKMKMVMKGPALKDLLLLMAKCPLPRVRTRPRINIKTKRQLLQQLLSY